MHSLLLAVCCILSGQVHAAGGAPLAQANVVLRGPETKTVTTDSKGVFSATAPPGDYQLITTVRGYLPASIDLKVEHDSTVDFSLEPVDAPTLRTIATITVDGRVTPQRGTIPSITISRADYDRLGYERVISGLLQVPSATFSHPDGGQSSAIKVVSLRGPDPSEAMVTLDGR